MYICYITILVFHASIKNVTISKTAAILKSLSLYYIVTVFRKLYEDKAWYKTASKLYKYTGKSYR